MKKKCDSQKLMVKILVLEIFTKSGTKPQYVSV